MFAFISLLALAAASAHPGSHGKAIPLSGSLQGLITEDDYPPEAVDNNEQGSVNVLLRVDAAGAVADCTVEHSASPSLDAKTCAVIRERAKFKPARDRHGKAVASETRGRVTWRIDDSPPLRPSAPWASTVVWTFGADGEPLSCQGMVEGAMERSKSAVTTCAPKAVPDPLRRFGAVDKLVVEERFALGAIVPPTLGPDEILAGRLVFALNVDAAGNITSCSVVEADPRLAPGTDGCAKIKIITFIPRRGADGTPSPFHGTLAFSYRVHVRGTGTGEKAAAPAR